MKKNNNQKEKLFTIDCGEILLREFILEDAEKIYTLANETDISKYLPDWKTSKQQRLEWVRDYEIPWNKDFLEAASGIPNIQGQMLKLGVILKRTNEFIGWCCTTIKKELPAPNREINYAISKDHCCKGYATKAALGMIKFLFEQTNIEHLIVIALLDNIPSNRVINKCGFRFVHKVTIKNEEYNYYDMSKDNWIKSIRK